MQEQRLWGPSVVLPIASIQKRPDAHITFEGGADCLHHCWPGPFSVVALTLATHLKLLGSSGLNKTRSRAPDSTLAYMPCNVPCKWKKRWGFWVFGSFPFFFVFFPRGAVFCCFFVSWVLFWWVFLIIWCYTWYMLHDVALKHYIQDHNGSACHAFPHLYHNFTRFWVPKMVVFELHDAKICCLGSGVAPQPPIPLYRTGQQRWF